MPSSVGLIQIVRLTVQPMDHIDTQSRLLDHIDTQSRLRWITLTPKAGNIKLAFSQSFEMRNHQNKNGGRHAAGVRPCDSLIAVLRSAPMWGRSGASSVEELAFMSAKSLKIGASGGAAQAAEAMGGKSLIFRI